MATAAPTQQVLLLDPTLILADDNVRFGLKRVAVDSLKADVLEHGGIHTPGEVEVLQPPVDGKKYRLTVGAYRLASVLELNEHEKAGLLFPAIVRPSGSPVDRLKRQLSENLERESMSPLDAATAIKKLLDAGVPKSEIRTIFARPGGKKGTEVVPASNAWVNMTLSFLDLPKPIQEKIHLGLVGVGAAYELTKVSPEKRQSVLDRAEAERVREQEKESTYETKLLNDEKKAKDAADKIATAKMAADVLGDELKIAQETLKAKTDEAAEAYRVMASLPKEADDTVKEKAKEKFLALETDIKGAKKTVAGKQGELAKIQKVTSGTLKAADGIKERLAAARKGKAGKGKGKVAGPSARQMKAAAKAEGDGNHVPLDLAAIRSCVKLMANSRYPTIKHFGKALQDNFNGIGTDAMMIDSLAEFVGDKVTPKVKPAK